MAAFYGSHANPHHLPNHLFPWYPLHTAIHHQSFLQDPFLSFHHTHSPYVHPAQSFWIDFESTHKRLLGLFGTEGTLPPSSPTLPLKMESNFHVDVEDSSSRGDIVGQLVTPLHSALPLESINNFHCDNSLPPLVLEVGNHADEKAPCDTVEELVLLGTLELSSKVPPLPMTQVAAQVVLLSLRPVSVPEFLSKLPPLVTKHVGAQVVLPEVFHTVHQHYRHGHCNMISYGSVILHGGR